MPEHRFEELCDYVKQRIDKTVLGKNNRSKGIRNYQVFEKFCLSSNEIRIYEGISGSAYLHLRLQVH